MKEALLAFHVPVGTIVFLLTFWFIVHLYGKKAKREKARAKHQEYEPLESQRN